MGKVLKGQDLWGQLEGKKNELKDEVKIKFGDVEGEIAVVFRDADIIQAINEEYERKMPPKPTLQLDGLKKPITIPSDKYKKFNNHPKAIEWEESVRPINKDKVYHLAYCFIADDEKPAEDEKEGVEILKDRLRFMDAVNIMNSGFNLSGFLANSNQQEGDF